MKYALISAARNEESFITHTLESVCAQSVLPQRWVIVDDGSTDRTAEIVESYSRRCPWLELIRQPVHDGRAFAAKARAFNFGWARVASMDLDVIGNIDADVSFDGDYLEFLLQRFEADPRLGVAGTPFVEDGYDSARDSFEGVKHVAGGVQLFRRACLQQIGGYVREGTGGIDWIAVTTARMRGWRTRSFYEKRFRHWRRLGTASRSTLAAHFVYGEKDYYLGGSPVWQVCRVGFRSFKRPYVLGGVALGLGYSCAALRGIPRHVSPELRRFHRAEQWGKLKIIIGGLVRLRLVSPADMAILES